MGTTNQKRKEGSCVREGGGQNVLLENATWVLKTFDLHFGSYCDIARSIENTVATGQEGPLCRKVIVHGCRS